MFKPCLKVVGLHIEGLRVLRRVDWPADGLGWDGQVPDMVLVGGVNGSGKTTLLEFVADAARMLRGDGPVMWSQTPTVNAWIDFKVAACGDETRFRFIVGEKDFAELSRTEDSLWFFRASGEYLTGEIGDTRRRVRSSLMSNQAFRESDVPAVVYLSNDRKLEIPEAPYKAAGRLNALGEFFFRFKPPGKWQDSLEALLYAARWADLNAKEEGNPEEARHFETYAKAFEAFFGGGKRLVWERGELFVKIANTGERHTLMELSSGEKQVIIFAAELLRRWRPGSLILVDGLELHFHPTWQTTLWSMLTLLQKERGGQVIAATQSSHLFRIAEPGTKLLLGGEELK